jgi:hypothetical protein
MPLVPVLSRIERRGVLISRELLVQQSGELGKRLLELEGEAHELAGQPFNLSSPKQLGDILFDKLQLPVLKKTPKGAPSTAEEVLMELALDYPAAPALLEYRSLSKLKSTYTDKLPEMINAGTGRVHTSYHQAVAATGRLSSTIPTCRTSRSARRRAGAFARRLSHQRATRSSRPTTRRLNCASWRICRPTQGLLKAFQRGPRRAHRHCCRSV